MVNDLLCGRGLGDVALDHYYAWQRRLSYVVSCGRGEQTGGTCNRLEVDSYDRSGRRAGFTILTAVDLVEHDERGRHALETTCENLTPAPGGGAEIHDPIR